MNVDLIIITALLILILIGVPLFIGLLLRNTRSANGVVARLRKAGL
jgi:hypothetical protein